MQSGPPVSVQCVSGRSARAVRAQQKSLLLMLLGSDSQLLGGSFGLGSRGLPLQSQTLGLGRTHRCGIQSFFQSHETRRQLMATGGKSRASDSVHIPKDFLQERPGQVAIDQLFLSAIASFSFCQVLGILTHYQCPEVFFPWPCDNAVPLDPPAAHLPL